MITALAEQGVAPQEALRVVLGALSSAADVLPQREWEAACLDTLVHLANASGGLLLDGGGVLIASVGMSGADVLELSTIAHEYWPADGSPVRVHLPLGALDAIRLPLRAGGRNAGTLVLTTDCSSRFGADLGAVVPALSSVARDLLTTPAPRGGQHS